MKLPIFLYLFNYSQAKTETVFSWHFSQAEPDCCRGGVDAQSRRRQPQGATLHQCKPVIQVLKSKEMAGSMTGSSPTLGRRRGGDRPGITVRLTQPSEVGDVPPECSVCVASLPHSLLIPLTFRFTTWEQSSSHLRKTCHLVEKALTGIFCTGSISPKDASKSMY